MPKSDSRTLILRRSSARMVSCVMGSSYCRPVRLSTTVSVSRGLATAATSPLATDPGFVGFIHGPLGQTRLTGNSGVYKRYCTTSCARDEACFDTSEPYVKPSASIRHRTEFGLLRIRGLGHGFGQRGSGRQLRAVAPILLGAIER